MEHISLEKIYSYIEGQMKGHEANDVEGHVAVCEKCHRLFFALKDLGSSLKKCFPVEAREGCPEDWEIAASIKHELEPDNSEEVNEHINSCNYCLDRTVMYYKAGLPEEVTVKTPVEWAEKAANVLQGKEGVPVIKEDIPILERIYGSIQEIFSTLPPLPGYAVAALAVFLLIWNMSSEPIRILNITSSQRIAFENLEAPSSFAFMGGEEVKEFEGMEVNRAGKELVFSWKPITGGEVSEFILKKKGITKDITIVTLPVKGEKVTISIEKVKYNERYEWTISGLMEDGRKFTAAAEFVLGK